MGGLNMMKLIKFSQKEIDFVDNECKEKEISFTEVIRRLVDKEMDRKENDIK